MAMKIIKYHLLFFFIFKIMFFPCLAAKKPNNQVSRLLEMHLVLKSNLTGLNGIKCLFTLGNLLRNENRILEEFKIISAQAYYIEKLTAGQNGTEATKTKQNLKIIIQYLIILLNVHDGRVSYFFPGHHTIIQQLENLMKQVPGKELSQEDVTKFIEIKNFKKDIFFDPDTIKRILEKNSLLRTFIQWLEPLVEDHPNLTCSKIVLCVIPKAS